MKSFTPLLFLSLAPVTAAQDPQPPEWKPFTPAGGRFTVQFPGTPVEQKQKFRTPAGEVDLTLFVFERKGEGTLAVGYSDLPEADAVPGLEQRRLDNARDGLVARAK